MARRRRFEDPVSRLAIWARRLALFALTVALLAIVVLRLDYLEIVPGLVTFAGALTIAAAALVLALGAFVAMWREGVRGFAHALLAFALGAALLAYPAYLAIRGYGLPAISDIVTDVADPPRFEAIARLRPREANSVDYPGPANAMLQRAHYPQIEPLDTTSTAQETYQAALAAMTKRKWRVVDTRPPQARREGHIEAVARTAIMGFRDDVVVRIRRTEAGARLDMRSASRYGRHDFGANAQRVRAFLDELGGTLGQGEASQ